MDRDLSLQRKLRKIAVEVHARMNAPGDYEVSLRTVYDLVVLADDIRTVDAIIAEWEQHREDAQ